MATKSSAANSVCANPSPTCHGKRTGSKREARRAHLGFPQRWRMDEDGAGLDSVDGVNGGLGLRRLGDGGCSAGA